VKQAKAKAKKESIPNTGTTSLKVKVSFSSFMIQGVVYDNGYKYTYYSQSVLPGGGLSIPGRHVDESGYIVDANDYIVLAGSAAIGTIYPTPFGKYGKIYDRGTVGNHLDVYVK